MDSKPQIDHISCSSCSRDCCCVYCKQEISTSSSCCPCCGGQKSNPSCASLKRCKTSPPPD